MKTSYNEIEKRMYDSFDWNGDKWHFISVQGLAMVFDLQESTVKKIIKKWKLEKKNTLVQGTFQTKVGIYYKVPYFAKQLYPKLRDIYNKMNLKQRKKRKKITFSLYYL